MNRLVGLINSSLGQKLILAASGLALIGFLVAHLVGNLTLFQGREAMNAYAAWLKGHPLLWIARAGLASFFLIHITLAIRLALANRRSRRIAYHHARQNQETTMASRYILLTGLLVLSFLIYHLLHFTLGGIHTEHTQLVDAAGRHDVYGMVVSSFSVPAIAISYGVSMLVLGLHLLHGVRSLFQTFGLNHETYNGVLKSTSLIVVAGLVLGNLSIPLSVWFGLIKP